MNIINGHGFLSYPWPFTNHEGDATHDDFELTVRSTTIGMISRHLNNTRLPAALDTLAARCHAISPIII